QGVEDDKGERNEVQNDDERVRHPLEKSEISLRASSQRAHLPQSYHGKVGHRKACYLAQYELRVRPGFQPPPDRDVWPVPLGVIESVVNLRVHRFPQGRSHDLNHSIAPTTLYCWIAPAGSTPLGHAFVHSPTKVHCHMPSCSEQISSRSPAP